MKVCIVKLSSMGDLVQLLPAITDASNAKPNISFDWVVDERFAEVPLWHSDVKNIIVAANKRWAKNILNSILNKDIKKFYTKLRQKEYDVIIDAQGNLKSALVTSLISGTKHGLDSISVREKGANYAYNVCHRIEKKQLSVNRWRKLFAQALDYPLPNTQPNFGLSEKLWPEYNIENNKPYVVFVTNASWSSKLLPVDNWFKIISLAAESGYQVLLPWGNNSEYEFAKSLATLEKSAVVLPKLSITQVAGIIKRSSGAICNDTGLAHIAASLDVPTVTLYGPTDANLIGATGSRSKHLSASGLSCIPCYKRTCAISKGQDAECLKSLGADNVWGALLKLISQV